MCWSWEISRCREKRNKSNIDSLAIIGSVTFKTHKASLRWRRQGVRACHVTATRLFIQQRCKPITKGIKLPHHLSFLGEIQWWLVGFLHIRPMMQKAFTCHEIIMKATKNLPKAREDYLNHTNDQTGYAAASALTVILEIHKIPRNKLRVLLLNIWITILAAISRECCTNVYVCFIVISLYSSIIDICPCWYLTPCNWSKFGITPYIMSKQF